MRACTVARLLGTALVASLAACGNAAGPMAPPPPPDVTARVERLGNPFTVASPYARNVWDMQLFGGVVRLGHGDSADNRGPIPIWSVDPATGALASEFTTSEEQVDLFRVLDGELYVPGHDPRDDLTAGNFYRVEAGRWVKHRTIPHGLHTFDLAWHDGLLFAALGADNVPGHETLKVSADRGHTWRVAGPALDRMYGMFELGGALYAAPIVQAGLSPLSRQPWRWNGAAFVPTGTAMQALLPGLPEGRGGRMVRQTEFAGGLVYVVAVRDFDWYPVGLAVTRDARAAEPVTLPDPAALPFDLLVRGGTLYLLTGTPAADGGYTVRVYATADLARWTELFHLAAPTFARSFEESGGDFFLGLGCQYAAHSPAAGDLLRVRRASYAR
ncbi:MAG TPA: hypothetical protein VEX86_24550 [Longimicrobium sp.]|nr:hypothetical protein [Longimicrobium sp.]